MTSEYVIVSKSELDLKKWAVEFTLIDLERIVEYRESFVKFLDKSIHKLQSDHWLLKDVGKEGETYIAINTIQSLKQSLEWTFEMFKQHIEDTKAK